MTRSASNSQVIKFGKGLIPSWVKDRKIGGFFALRKPTDPAAGAREAPVAVPVRRRLPSGHQLDPSLTQPRQLNWNVGK